MPLDTPSTQLSQVIAQVTAPAFLLGAVAAFISVLIARIKAPSQICNEIFKVCWLNLCGHSSAQS